MTAPLPPMPIQITLGAVVVVAVTLLILGLYAAAQAYPYVVLGGAVGWALFFYVRHTKADQTPAP